MGCGVCLTSASGQRTQNKVLLPRRSSVLSTAQYSLSHVTGTTHLPRVGPVLVELSNDMLVIGRGRWNTAVAQ